MFIASKKKQILKEIYEENLWVVGKRDIRKTNFRTVAAPVNQRQGWLPLLGGMVSILVVAGVVIAWHKPINHQPRDVVIASLPADSVDKAVVSKSSVFSPLEHKTTAPVQSVPYPGSLDAIQALENPVPNPVPLLPHQTGREGAAEAVSVSMAVEPLPVNLGDYKVLLNSEISVAEIFGLGVQTIVIDPGHGGKDPGAIGRLGVFEKDIALEIAQQLKERLLAYNHYKVLLTRESDVSMSLNDRILFANNNNADIFISIHVNYFPSEQKNFIETYYFGPTRDIKAKKLAALENADSNYSYAELKDVLQKIGDTLKLQESKQLAVSVQSNLFQQIAKIDRKTSNHGVKSAPFVVLLGLDAPSILTEVTCLCNQREEERLGTTEYRNDIAAFLEQGIVNYLNKNTQLGGKRNGEKEKLAQTQ